MENLIKMVEKKLDVILHKIEFLNQKIQEAEALDESIQALEELQESLTPDPEVTPKLDFDVLLKGEGKKEKFLN